MSQRKFKKFKKFHMQGSKNFKKSLIVKVQEGFNAKGLEKFYSEVSKQFQKNWKKINKVSSV